MDTCENDSDPIGIGISQHDVPLDCVKTSTESTNSNQKCTFYIKKQKRCCKLNIFPRYKYCTRHISEQQPLQIVDKPEECPVCIETFDEDDSPLTCGHWVHKECIIKSGKGQCPVCRFDLYLSTKEKQECAVYRQRYSNNNFSSRSSTSPSALGAQIDAILMAYPREIQNFIHDVGLDNIIDSHLYNVNPLLFQHTLIAYLETHTQGRVLQGQNTRNTRARST